MRSGQTCTGERVDKRCQLGRASSELLMAALFRSFFSSIALLSKIYFPHFFPSTNNSFIVQDLLSSLFPSTNNSFIPRLLVFPERMRVATTPLLITVWGYVRSEQADFMKILSRPQWPSMSFCLWILQGIFPQGLWIQTQMSPCHLVSRIPLKVSRIGMVHGMANKKHEKNPIRITC